MQRLRSGSDQAGLVRGDEGKEGERKAKDEKARTGKEKRKEEKVKGKGKERREGVQVHSIVHIGHLFCECMYARTYR